MVPGPVNWVTAKDLCNLQTAYHFPAEFKKPSATAQAAKLRVATYVVPDCEMRSAQLQKLLDGHGRRDFETWHIRAYVTVLAEAVRHLAARGVTKRTVLEHAHDKNRGQQTADDKVSFQRNAHD